MKRRNFITAALAALFGGFFASKAKACEVPERKVQSRRSGNWDDRNTWVGGKVPTKDDKVEILKGHHVLVGGVVVASALNVLGSITVTRHGHLNFNGGMPLNGSNPVYGKAGEWILYRS